MTRARAGAVAPSQQALLAAGLAGQPARHRHRCISASKAALKPPLIQRDDLQLPHLGWLSYHDLDQALDRGAGASSVQFTVHGATVTGDLAVGLRRRCVSARWPDPATTRLVALAEGGALAASLPGMRRHEHDYQQSA